MLLPNVRRLCNFSFKMVYNFRVILFYDDIDDKDNIKV